MDKKAEKDASKLANFILNNMSISEALHILAKKSQEVAEDMIKNNINHSEYKTTLLKNENKESKSSTSILDKALVWFRGLTNKNEPTKNEPELKSIPQDAPKQILKNKTPTRAGFSTKKKKNNK